MAATNPDISLSTLLTEIEGIKLDRKQCAGLEKLGLFTVADLLEHYPKRYEDRRHFEAFPDHPREEAVCLHGVVTDSQTKYGKNRRRFFEATIEAPGGSVLGQQIVLRWFNMPYISKLITVGHEMILYGKPKMSGRRLVMDHPEYEILDGDPEAVEAHMGRIVPIYRMASGIAQKPLRAMCFTLLESITDEDLPDWLPPGSMENQPKRCDVVRTIHYPDSLEETVEARRYLALEEFTKLQMVLLEKKRAFLEKGGRAHCGSVGLLSEYLENLPFTPTGAQSRVIDEIRGDLKSSRPMARLLQGDVGAGKTLVAAAAILLVIEAGFDAALMAPTQILAEQHYQNFQEWFEPLGITVKLRTGTKSTGDDLPLFDAGTDLGSLTIGTHALIHSKSGFEKELGLAVIDEQHKFGVDQRQALIDQGDSPDVLVMTATPIPRTLTLSFYGDLDVSILDELPPGRGKIITGIRLTTQTDKAAIFLKDQLAEGRQIYIVYPLIDESEKINVAAASAEFERWKKRLPDFQCALLHGRMSNEEKDAVMEQFRTGKTDVLVSTTVIEVGVDVANANVMLIYHAERFGLAQLHQLRGRIGRGKHKSYCVLMCDPEKPEARERLKILEETRDGFRIAEEDLNQRGPGEVLGTQQSGLPELEFVYFLGDTHLVQHARQLAMRMLENGDE